MKRMITIIGFAMALCWTQDAVAQENTLINPWCKIKYGGESNRQVSALFVSNEGDEGFRKVPGNPDIFNHVQLLEPISGTEVVYQECCVYSAQNSNVVALKRTYTFWKQQVDFESIYDDKTIVVPFIPTDPQ